MQAEILFLIHFLGFDHPAYETLNLRDKPDEDEGVGHIERGMEGSQHEAQLSGVGQEHAGLHGFLLHRHVVAYPAAHHIYKGTEHEQNPDDAKHIEEHVGQCCPSSLSIGRKGCQVGGDGGADVLTHHQRDTLIDGQCT